MHCTRLSSQLRIPELVGGHQVLDFLNAVGVKLIPGLPKAGSSPKEGRSSASRLDDRESSNSQPKLSNRTVRARSKALASLRSVRPTARLQIDRSGPGSAVPALKRPFDLARSWLDQLQRRPLGRAERVPSVAFDAIPRLIRPMQRSPFVFIGLTRGQEGEDVPWGKLSSRPGEEDRIAFATSLLFSDESAGANKAVGVHVQDVH